MHLRLSPLAAVFFAGLSLVEPVTGATGGYVSERDTFSVTYTYQVPTVAKGETAQIWLPIATSDAFQTIASKIDSEGLAVDHTQDGKFHNALLHVTATAANAGKKVTITYHAERREKGAYPVTAGEDMAPYLAAETLVPLDSRFKKLAATATAGKTDAMSKGRALYDYVLKEMKYDKSGTGWGRGDAVYACDAKTGNCTDFHALFIALARSAGIPARFAIGFTVPSEGTTGKIEGYHCWAEFRADDQWVPVDISEASKAPQFKDYYFGHHPANRLQLSQGRWLELAPAPKEGPVNFLVHPYVEVNGKPVKGVTGTYAFTRATAPVTKS